MVATAPRIHNGLVLPAIPRAAAEPVFALEPAAYLPRGYSLREDASGLHLMREADGADLGPMASEDFAFRHASALAREEQRRAAQLEEQRQRVAEQLRAEQAEGMER